jgi:very-short-patch-repair endonuclease
MLSGAAAAHLYGLLKGAAPAPEVTTRTERQVKGVITHRARRLDPRDATSYQGIPITTVPRTLVDVAATLTAEVLAQAFHEAAVRHRISPAHVEAVLQRCPKRPGAGRLRSVMTGETSITLSHLERAFLQLLREHELPLPTTNRPAGKRYVDCRWPAHRLTVELDSYRYHHTRHAWELDRRREREAYARGDDFRRFTYDDVTADPTPLLEELTTLLPPPARTPPAPAARAHGGRSPGRSGRSRPPVRR